MPDFPAGIPDIPDSSTFETLFTMHSNVGHAAGTNRILANLRELSRKLGIGASTPSGPGVLRQGSAGVSAWGLLQAADVGARVLTPGLLNAGGTATRVLTTTDGINAAWATLVPGMLGTSAVNAATQIAPGIITDTQINTSAGIALTKLLPGTAGFLRSNASIITAGNQVQAGDIATDAVGTLKGVQLGTLSTSSPTVEDIAGATITWTSLNKPARVIVTLVGISLSAGTAALVVQLFEGVSPWGTLMGDSLTAGVASTRTSSFFQATPGAGAHTYRLRWSTSSGTVTVSAVSFSVQELH